MEHKSAVSRQTTKTACSTYCRRCEARLYATRTLELLALMLLFAHGGCKERLARPGVAPPRDTAEAGSRTTLPSVRAIFVSPGGKTAVFELEVASTPGERARGLMFRKELAPDRGMLFVFPREEVQYFYMKNTYIPLDMIFISAKRVVLGVVENAQPLTLKTRTIDKPSKYVVEMRAFGARTHGIVPGTVVRFDPEPPEPAE